VYWALLSACRALLSVYRALLSVYRALLSVSLQRESASSDVCGTCAETLLRVGKALLSVCRAVGVYIGLF